jgi:hypothetical protein
MTIEATCERCGASRRFPARLAGRTGRCEHCRAWLKVPTPGTGPDSGLRAAAPGPATGPFDGPPIAS